MKGLDQPNQFTGGIEVNAANLIALAEVAA